MAAVGLPIWTVAVWADTVWAAGVWRDVSTPAATARHRGLLLRVGR
jgi:hypothetical protein